MLGRLITTLPLVFAMFAVFFAGSVTSNVMIDGEDSVMMAVGLATYFLIGISEILLGYVVYKIWS